MTEPKKIPIKQLMDALLDTDIPLHPRFLYRLSDLSQADMNALQKTWPKVPAWRRQNIMEDIEDLGSSDYVLSFDSIARYGLRDEEPRVRELAVRTLWEYEERDLIPIYLHLLVDDPDPDVRAVTATALGKFIFLGEIEELPESTLHRIEDCLLEVTRGNDVTLVRRRALESLGFSSREEVPALIESASNSGSSEWLVSALFAMGQSANREWNPSVLSNLDSDRSDVLFEAVRAAGELEIKQAVPRLMEILEEDDSDVRSAATWSLSQIGGEGVRQRLEELYDETEDDVEADFIDDALDNLDFTEDVALFDLLDVEDEDDDLDEFEELEDEEED
jgi:HEAT repeat protein